MFRSLFPTRNDNILSRSPDTLNPVYGGYESRFGPLTDEKIRETFFDIYLGNYPEADGFNSGKKASTSVVSKQYDVVSSMRNPNSILYGATVQDIAQSIGSTPEALTNWLLD
ncbi:hypothetical protein EBU91_04895, partial [bacterium]|nr:hypothetical protein [bacterium]